MTTAVDTNVIVALWDKNKLLSSAAESALERALAFGGLVLSAPVVAELMAAPGRSEAFINAFLLDTGIHVDWDLGKEIWRTAGRAFQKYASRRRSSSVDGPRRILADFLIGAHAIEADYPLLTLDTRLYRAAFPRLRLIEI